MSYTLDNLIKVRDALHHGQTEHAIAILDQVIGKQLTIKKVRQKFNLAPGTGQESDNGNDGRAETKI